MKLIIWNLESSCIWLDFKTEEGNESVYYCFMYGNDLHRSKVAPGESRYI